MRGICSFFGGLWIAVVASFSARAQAPLRPTILIDGHIAGDTALSLAMAKSVQITLAGLLRGTGVGVAPLFVPADDMPGRTPNGDLSDVTAAERIHHADIAVEINALRSQDGNIFLAPTIVLRHSPQVDMAAISGQSIDAIARTIAQRIAKDSTRMRRLAEEDLRGDTTGTRGRPH